MTNADDIRNAVIRLADLALELHSPGALLSRPHALSGRVSVKEERPAPSEAEWLETRRVDTTEVRSSASPAPGNIAVMDLRLELPCLLHAWADYVAEELREEPPTHAADYLIYHRERIALLSLCGDLVAEFKSAIHRAEVALGITEQKGLLCSCGTGRLVRDLFDQLTCSYCYATWTELDLARELAAAVTIEQAADIFGKSGMTIRRAIKREGLISLTATNPAKYRVEDIERAVSA